MSFVPYPAIYRSEKNAEAIESFVGCTAYYTLHTECDVDYYDPQFIAEVAKEDFDPTGLTLLQL